MLRRDLILFVPVFITYITMFWIFLYSLYPVQGMQNVEQFNAASPFETLFSVLMLAVAGDTFDIEITDDYRGASFNTAPMLSLNFALFMCAYVIFIAITVILLLNLLIARMNSTYEIYREASEVEWRGMFARRVIRLENNFITKIIACFIKIQLVAGEPDGQTFKKDVEVNLTISKENDKTIRTDSTFFNIPTEVDLGGDHANHADEADCNHIEAPHSVASQRRRGSTRMAHVGVDSLKKGPETNESVEGEKTKTVLKSMSISRVPNAFFNLPAGEWQYDDSKLLSWADPSVDDLFGQPFQFGKAAGWTDGLGGKVGVKNTNYNDAEFFGSQPQSPLQRAMDKSANDDPLTAASMPDGPSTQMARMPHASQVSSEYQLRRQLNEQEALLEQLQAKVARHLDNDTRSLPASPQQVQMSSHGVPLRLAPIGMAPHSTATGVGALASIRARAEPQGLMIVPAAIPQPEPRANNQARS